MRDVGYEPPTGPALISGFAYRLILERCANVEEAIARLEKFVATAPPGTPNVEVAKSLIAALQKK